MNKSVNVQGYERHGPLSLPIRLLHTDGMYEMNVFRFRGTVIGNHYGPGVGSVPLASVHCVGNEPSIADCAYSDIHICNRNKDVSMSCSTPPVQYGKPNQRYLILKQPVPPLHLLYTLKT